MSCPALNFFISLPSAQMHSMNRHLWSNTSSLSLIIHIKQFFASMFLSLLLYLLVIWNLDTWNLKYMESINFKVWFEYENIFDPFPYFLSHESPVLLNMKQYVLYTCLKTDVVKEPVLTFCQKPHAFIELQ